MKKIILVVSVLALCSAFTFSPGDPVHHGPLLVIDTSNTNFGLVPNIGEVEHAIVLRNEGDETLHITGGHPSCGCTVVALKDSLVAPGKETTLLIRFSEKNHPPGEFKKEVSILSNSRDSEQKSFWFYGRLFAAPGSDTARTHTFVKHSVKQ
ncbi:MAG: DUF1573 domain-containing protein [Bacteroidota bacterium]|nr:DUF1573 domain-containing protein [Bacteroidota bacterium]MDP4233085.1 DUF1573 domain-containing protein [Bacteroidota bacterium]MDP4241770.1 DUF1573 domain-containing protein [Bacteroidota bacterium]MDP4287428.1 DUF1573 domain-containing protein [Bacteroidota bacterium]